MNIRQPRKEREEKKMNASIGKKWASIYVCNISMLKKFTDGSFLLAFVSFFFCSCNFSKQICLMFHYFYLSKHFSFFFSSQTKVHLVKPHLLQLQFVYIVKKTFLSATYIYVFCNVNLTRNWKNVRLKRNNPKSIHQILQQLFKSLFVYKKKT